MNALVKAPKALKSELHGHLLGAGTRAVAMTRRGRRWRAFLAADLAEEHGDLAEWLEVGDQ
jgi:hypothetical protein